MAKKKAPTIPTPPLNQYACAALTGLLANMHHDGSTSVEDVVERAFEYALEMSDAGMHYVKHVDSFVAAATEMAADDALAEAPSKGE